MVSSIARKVGQRVTYAGYPGTITESCRLAPTMVVVRLASGSVCVGFGDCRAVTP